MKKAVFEYWAEMMAEPESPDPTRDEMIYGALKDIFDFITKEGEAKTNVLKMLGQWLDEFRNS